MPVTSRLSSLVDFSGAPLLPGYGGGGQGAAVNNDVIIEGTQSAGRRVDNATNKGFGASFTAANLSGVLEHVKLWLFVTQWAEVTQVQVRLSSGSVDDHVLPVSEFPALGGFIPVWVDVSRTTESGGAADEAAINEVGVLLDIGDVGGNAPNLILDEIMHGTSGLLWDGTSGAMSDFRAYEEANNEGSVITLNGVDFVYSRIEIGSSAATTFTDSGFTLIFPDQSLVAENFMGITIDLQNASTDVQLSNATVQSSNPASAARRPDLIVTGSSGVASFTNLNFLGMRTVSLTSGVEVSGGIVDAVAMIQGGALVSNVSIGTRSVLGVAFLSDPGFNSLTDIVFTQNGSGHAIEITTPGTYTLSSLEFVGYGAAEANDASVYNNSGGAVTLNLSGGSGLTVRNGLGATTIVNNTVTLTITGVPNGLEARLRLGSVTIPGQYVASVTGNQAVFSLDAAAYAGRTAILTVGGVADDTIAYERQDIPLEVPTVDQTIPVGFLINPSYI